MSDSIKRTLSTSVAAMIITWINNFYRPGLKSIKELSNAQIFIDLIQLLLPKDDYKKEFDEIKSKNTQMRYEFIKFFFEKKLNIGSGVNFEFEKSSLDFELGKVRIFILLANFFIKCA